MDIRLPIPNNWQDFESICHRLWMDIWNDSEAQKNGRQGQSQNGVDIFGRPLYSGKFHGVQCKDKDSRLGSLLSSEELLNECNKAKDFKPSINHYTMATTASRDATIQEYYRKLNDEKTLPFSVNVWSWNDIESEIAFRPAILKHYYSSIHIPEIEFDSVKLNRFSSKDHFYAFFSRPKLNESLSKKFKKYLVPVVYELMDNAYLHGKATTYEIKIENNSIQLIDNGINFNPLTDLDASKVSAESNVGSFVLKSFLEIFEKIETNYTRTETNNIIELKVDDSTLLIDDDLHFEINIDLREAYGRENAKVLASRIPLDKAEIILNVTEVWNVSVFVEFTNEALRRMTDKQTLIISMPRHNYLGLFSTWFKDERLKIQMR